MDFMPSLPVLTAFSAGALLAGTGMAVGG